MNPVVFLVNSNFETQLALCPKAHTEIWCNGSTIDFGPISRGSNPRISTPLFNLGLSD